MADFVLEEILKKVISLAAEEISLVWGFKQDLQKLRGSLVFIQALLQDAGKKQIENAAIRIWMQKLQNLVYDAEDVLDEFGYELLRQKIKSPTHLKKVCDFFSSSNSIVFRLKIAHKIKNINQALEKIRSESNGLGLVHLRYVESVIEETDSILDNSEVIGRDKEVSAILNIISESSSSISVVPIVGMPGLGKTTFARLLTKEVENKKLFDKTIWVCVSNIFDERIILRRMLESLDKTAGGIEGIDAVLKYIRENLENKSFFLVLDDLWNEEVCKWESLMTRLLKINKNKRNCILVTTRSERVASIIESNSMQRYYPTKLSDDECWSIIKKKVYGNAFEVIPQDLIVIGRDIASKCTGLPLLARVLGGTMQLRKDGADWSSIRDSPVWSTLTQNNEILHVLKLSFDRLSSSSLKQCFAYCAIFPEDYVIEKNKLIQLWIAQGYVYSDQERNMTVEEVGHQYFKILLANSLFQDIEKDKFGNIKNCKMHDAVHALTKFVSRSEIWISNSVTSSNTLNIRHVRQNFEADIATKFEETSCRKLRSFFSDVKVYGNTLRTFKRMRVLDIHDSDTTTISTSSVQLKHLRYLDISNNPIEVLPRAMTKLYNLQTLRVTNCNSLLKPLRGAEHLVNLKHFIFDDPDLIPSHIGELTCLQTLQIFAVTTTKGHGIEELGSLKQLQGKLQLWGLENVKGKSNAYEADIKGKLKLQNLTYAWCDGIYLVRRKLNTQEQNKENDVLDGLEPHRHLLRLKIRNFGGEGFSAWLSDHYVLGRLRRLKLCFCLNCTELPTLGEMPCLEYLWMKNIDNVKRIGKEFYTRIDRANAGSETVILFPSLIKLHMECMSSLEEWILPTGEGIVSFPCLELVSIIHCHELTIMPMIQSKSLRNLEISWCPKLMSLPVNHLSSLEELVICNCQNLSDFEGVNGSVLGVLGLTSLVKLKIWESGICFLPSGLRFSKSLQYFKIWDLPNLTLIPDYIGDLTSLVEFEIAGCETLTNIPSRLQSCKSLTNLMIINCDNLENVLKMENLEELSSLEHLDIVYCPKLIDVPTKIPVFHKHLKVLGIGGFSSGLEAFPSIDSDFKSSVAILKLFGQDQLKSFPSLQFHHFTSLKSLEIVSFDGIDILPEGLGKLSSLVSLYIIKCKNLRSLPESMTRLTNLKQLHMSRCHILATKLSNGDVTECSKISHIRKIEIDGWKFRG